MRTGFFKYLVILLGIAIAGVALYLFILTRPLLVEVISASENEPIKVFGLGTVEARVLSRVGFEVGAALVELRADHGDSVKAGDAIARLHSSEQQARVAKAEAGMAKAEAAVKMAEATVEKARVALSQRRQTNRRKQALLAAKSIPIEDAEEAQMEEDIAVADLAVAVSDLEVGKAALADARAQFKLEEVLLDQHELRAPYDSIVVQRHKELGSVLIPGEPVFTVVAPETVWALAYVDEAGAGDIRVGQPAEVRLRSLPRETFTGHVIRIDIESDRVSEERRVYIACDRCPDRFFLGEQAEVFITTAVVERALFVPESVVEGFDGTAGKIWTVENGVLRRRHATFGRRTLDSRLEVVEGVQRKTLVVKQLRPGLREGRRARIFEQE